MNSSYKQTRALSVVWFGISVPHVIVMKPAMGVECLEKQQSSMSSLPTSMGYFEAWHGLRSLNGRGHVAECYFRIPFSEE